MLTIVKTIDQKLLILGKKATTMTKSYRIEIRFIAEA